jgi:hypothetical protein
MVSEVNSSSEELSVLPLEYEVEWSVTNDKVWIHASDGSTVGRFSRFGIDLHNTVTDQLAGMPECRLCTHERPSVADWDMFREKALEWWDVNVPVNSFNQKLLIFEMVNSPIKKNRLI